MRCLGVLHFSNKKIWVLVYICTPVTKAECRNTSSITLNNVFIPAWSSFASFIVNVIHLFAQMCHHITVNSWIKSVPSSLRSIGTNHLCASPLCHRECWGNQTSPQPRSSLLCFLSIIPESPSHLQACKSLLRWPLQYPATAKISSVPASAANTSYSTGSWPFPRYNTVSFC